MVGLAEDTYEALALRTVQKKSGGVRVIGVLDQEVDDVGRVAQQATLPRKRHLSKDRSRLVLT